MNIDVTVLVALITALAAIIAPVVTAIINTSANRKLREKEVFEQNTKTCIDDLATSYAGLIDNQGYLQPYWNFVSAVYWTVSRIHNQKIQNHLIEFLIKIRAQNGEVNEDTHSQFDCIMLEISNYLQSLSK